MDRIFAFGQSLIDTPFNPNDRFSALYICCAIGLAFVLWLVSGRARSFREWLVPSAVYTHRSNLLDIKLFITNKFVDFIGLSGAVFFPTAVALSLMTLLSGWTGAAQPPDPTWLRSLIATIVVVTVSDFCKYWAHRWHHELKALWPFHAVHHSAEVLTPLTVMRAHPVESLIRNFLITAVLGLAQGVVLFPIVGQVGFLVIGGANAAYFLFNALGSNLRHSHIWLSYGRVMEHVFISPAQHQIHHSSAVRHHDKNYGSIFALWDWAFGTLYIPSQREELHFGMADRHGTPIQQPYETLGAALLNPFRESWEALRPRSDPQAPSAATGMTPGFSLWLDVLRAAAALTVLFGHMAHTRFTRGDYIWLREINIASDAVIVFFVLSGIVIAYAAGRDGSFGRFAFNRLTRVWTVVIPALVLTVVFDAIGTRISMDAYPERFYQSVPLWEMAWRGLTFTNEWQGTLSDRLRLGTNGPLWSLSYEVAFYALFACGLFLKGALRVVLLALIVVLVGLPILTLLPAWLLGARIWHLSQKGRVMPAARATALAIGSIVVLVLLKMVGAPDILTRFTVSALAPYNHHALLGYSDEVLWNSVIAICIALHLAGVKHLADQRRVRVDTPLARAIRWAAGASFSLYVVHYPTLHMLDAVLPETLPGYDIWLLGLTLTISLVFAALFERPLARYRGAARSVLRVLRTGFGTRTGEPSAPTTAR